MHLIFEPVKLFLYGLFSLRHVTSKTKSTSTAPKTKLLRTNSTILTVSQMSVLLINTLCGGVFIHLLLTASETSRKVVDARVCLQPFVLVYHQPHSSGMFLEQKMHQRAGDGHVSTPPQGQQRRPPH